MGQGASRSCADVDSSPSEWLCGSKRGGPNHAHILKASDPAHATIQAWIEAREQGDMDAAASYCHSQFVFASPQLSLTGLDAVKKRLFSKPAPAPIEVLTALQRREDTLDEERTPTYYREVVFKVGSHRSLAVRQEWVVALSSEGKRPRIMRVAAVQASQQPTAGTRAAPRHG